MLTTSITALLAGVQGLLPTLTSLAGSTSWVGTIITALETVVPDIIKNAPNEIAAVQSLITSLRSTSAPTPAELVALQAFEDQLDAAFEAAATAAGATVDDGA